MRRMVMTEFLLSHGASSENITHLSSLVLEMSLRLDNGARYH